VVPTVPGDASAVGGAGDAIGHGDVAHPEHRSTRIGRTGIAVVLYEGRAEPADTRDAGLDAGADVAIRAQGAVWHDHVLHPGRGVTDVEGAQIAVVTRGRCSRAAGSRPAGLGPVARVAVRAGG